MADNPDIADRFLRRYDRIYDPVANAKAIEEKNAAVARRAEIAKLFPKGKRDGA